MLEITEDIMQKISILLPYFDPNHDYPVEDNLIPDEFRCDVVFAGHYENDGRLEIIETIMNSNIDLKLYGGGWDKIIKRLPRSSPLKKILYHHACNWKKLSFSNMWSKNIIMFLVFN